MKSDELIAWPMVRVALNNGEMAIIGDSIGVRATADDLVEI